MPRAYLLLFFAIAFFGVLTAAAIWHRFSNPSPPPATTQPTTRSLIDRLKDERQRRMNEPPATQPDQPPSAP